MSQGSPSLPNARQEKFTQLVASGKSPTESYISAGFSPNGAAQSAQNLLKKTYIQERILSLRGPIVAAAVDRCAISKAWVLEGLRKNYERAMQQEAVLDREGNETGEFTYAGTVANRALELMGKELGMFIDRKDVTVRSLEDIPGDVLDQIIDMAERGESTRVN